jgi:hypothetical protein
MMKDTAQSEEIVIVEGADADVDAVSVEEDAEKDLDYDLEDLQDVGGDDDQDEIEHLLNKIILTMTRNACLAHLIQLAVKNALSSSDFVTTLLKKLNEIVLFFKRRDFWYSKLKAKTNNIFLLLPCVTRWNSQYHCIKRIFGENRQEVSFFFTNNNGRGRSKFNFFL